MVHVSSTNAIVVLGIRLEVSGVEIGFIATIIIIIVIIIITETVLNNKGVAYVSYRIV
jgi:hypothetical protein